MKQSVNYLRFVAGQKYGGYSMSTDKNKSVAKTDDEFREYLISKNVKPCENCGTNSERVFASRTKKESDKTTYLCKSCIEELN